MINSSVYELHKLVFTLDRVADKMVRFKFNISYKRLLFLVILYNEGDMTQHQLAQALGYSDPAVSNMLAELKKNELVVSRISSEHARKNIVGITRKGAKLAADAEDFLDGMFQRLIDAARVDEKNYAHQTQAIYAALVSRKGGLIK